MEGNGNEEESRRRSVDVCSAAAQSLKEDLEERRRQLDNATQTKDDIETRVEEPSKKSPGRAYSKERAGAAFRVKMKDMKVLEEAQTNQRDCLPRYVDICRFSTIFKMFLIAHSFSSAAQQRSMRF
jgi:hypothetical protein